VFGERNETMSCLTELTWEGLWLRERLKPFS
jgi:hypothetical protein